MGRQRGMARSGAPFLVVAVLLLSGVAARPGGTLEVQGDGASEGKGGADALYKKLADERHTAAAIFRRLDTDKDGSLSKQEPRSGNELAKDAFFRMDRNHDNKVSKAEYKAYYHADQHRAADRNGDGKVTLQEFLRAPQHYHGGLDKSKEEMRAEFNKADTNHDGKLSRKESENALVRSRQAALYTTDAADDADEDMWTTVTNPLIAGHDIDQPEIYPTSEESPVNIAQPLEQNIVPGDTGDANAEVEGISEKEEKEELKSL